MKICQLLSMVLSLSPEEDMKSRALTVRLGAAGGGGVSGGGRGGAGSKMARAISEDGNSDFKAS